MSRLASDHTASPLIFELGQDGRANRYVDRGAPLSDFLPPDTLRDELPLPDNSELEVVRHFTRLSQRTFGIDIGFYPLGSCRNCAICTRTRRTNWLKAHCRSCGNSSEPSARCSAWRRFHSTPRPARMPSSPHC
jgi:hypothetical protein